MGIGGDDDINGMGWRSRKALGVLVRLAGGAQLPRRTGVPFFMGGQLDE